MPLAPKECVLNVVYLVATKCPKCGNVDLKAVDMEDTSVGIPTVDVKCSKYKCEHIYTVSLEEWICE